MEEATHTLVLSVARAYKRKCWWAEVEDLAQVGYLAAFEAEPYFDEGVGVPFSAYIRRAIVLAMKRELWRMSAPVSGGMHRPEEQRAGLIRAPCDEHTKGEPFTGAKSTPDAERAMMQEEWRALVRARLVAHFTPEIVAVLLEERESKEVAQDMGVPPRQVYGATAKAKQTIASDLGMWQLFKERSP